MEAEGDMSLLSLCFPSICCVTFRPCPVKRSQRKGLWVVSFSEVRFIAGGVDKGLSGVQLSTLLEWRTSKSNNMIVSVIELHTGTLF